MRVLLVLVLAYFALALLGLLGDKGMGTHEREAAERIEQVR